MPRLSEIIVTAGFVIFGALVTLFYIGFYLALGLGAAWLIDASLRYFGVL